MEVAKNELRIGRSEEPKQIKVFGSAYGDQPKKCENLWTALKAKVHGTLTIRRKKAG